jgi:hypothetical protein
VRAVDPDRIDRVAKLLVDAGQAPTFPAAEAQLRTYRFQLVAGATACGQPEWQAALLTAVNAGVRAMHGGVRVILSDDPVCSLPVAQSARLSEALRAVGAEIAAEPDPAVATIAFGFEGQLATSGVPVVWAAAGRWTASVSTTAPAVMDPCPGAAEVPAAVLAGCLAVSEIFQWLRGHATAAHRDIVVSLWDPLQPTADGPAITHLPAGLWLLGLGHLGQAYAWLLSLLPYPTDDARPLVLQDDDRLSPANRATSMLHRDEQLGMRKTRLAASVLDELGWDTQLVERRYDGGRLHHPGAPAILLGGVDNPLARHRLDEAGMPLVYDAGLGAGPDGFLSITVRRLPAMRPSREIWPKEAPMLRRRAPAATAYAALEAETGDRCGVELLAGCTVATAFVGVTAACWVIGGVLRELHGGPAHELVDVSLRDPSGVTVLPAPLERVPRVATVARCG